MKLIFLGTGANGGIPQIDCNCRVCKIARTNPNEARTRSSLALETSVGKFILFDAGPDLRFQLSREGILTTQISHVFITHTHFDHVNGLFEFTTGKPHDITVHSHPKILEYISERYDLARSLKFSKKESAEIAKTRITGFEVPHTSPKFGPTLGFAVSSNNNSFVYIPDLAKYNKKTIDLINESDVAIVDGTFYDRPRFNHMSILETIAILKNTKASEIYFTHINHTEGLFNELERKIPDSRFKLSRDSQVLLM